MSRGQYFKTIYVFVMLQQFDKFLKFIMTLKLLKFKHLNKGKGVTILSPGSGALFPPTKPIQFGMPHIQHPMSGDQQIVVTAQLNLNMSLRFT